MRQEIIHFYNNVHDNENTVGMSPEEILIACEEQAENDDLTEEQIETISTLLAA